MYYQPEKNQKYSTHSEIRSAMSNVLFPPVIDDEMLAYVGVFPLVSIEPVVDADKTAEPISVELIDGAWTQMWNVRPATQQELDDRAAASKPQVPAEVTRRQARQALLLAGLLDKVEPAIAAITDPVQRGLAQIEWEDSQVFERQRPVLISLADAVGLDSDKLDQLFITAAGL